VFEERAAAPKRIMKWDKRPIGFGLVAAIVAATGLEAIQG